MQLWVIYKDCKHAPTRYCARNQDDTGFTGKEIYADSLEEVQKRLPAGFHRWMQSKVKDPLVIEIWQRLD